MIYIYVMLLKPITPFSRFKPYHPLQPSPRPSCSPGKRDPGSCLGAVRVEGFQ
jgi:hypothetical protein